jgi:hypothetical protein
MYKIPFYQLTDIEGEDRIEGETIEVKMERIISNNEPITDGAPIIHTERKDGVIAAYNIRTDRFEIAAEAMDKVSASITAKREEKYGHLHIEEGGKQSEDAGTEPAVNT